MGKGDEYAGYYCLMIAIICNVSADEAWLMYWHEPEHPVCQRIFKKRRGHQLLHEMEMQRGKNSKTGKEEKNGRL